MLHPFKALAAVAALTLTGAAHATVLTFDTYASIGAAAYGDRVTSFDSGYGSAGGATPNIVLDFVPASGTPFSVYSGGYASLVNALGHSGFNQPGYVQLTPDAGFDVVLSGFQLAAWSSSSYPDSRIQVLDSAGTVLLDSGLFTFAPNIVLNYPNAEIRSSLPLRIWINDFGDLGLDNVVFGQATTVPEVSTAAMLLAGLAVMGRLARRRRV